MKIIIVGGDSRMKTAYEILKKDYTVETLGLFSYDNADLLSADILLLPVPTTRDGVYVNSPLTDREISLEEIKALNNRPFILTAGYNFNTEKQIDYSALDYFCIKNAVPTAEGAIAAAITQTELTLFDAKILVIGYGKTGKILANRLSSFCKNLTVSARKQSDFAMLDSLGIRHLETKNTPKITKEFDIIFNTVDLKLFDDISAFKKTYLFDLSSKGCVDYSAVKDEKIKKLPGLPGKTAPLSSGRIIAETVKDIIRREFQ